MQRFEVDNGLVSLARKILGVSSLFVLLSDEHIDNLIKLAGDVEVFEDGEQVIAAGDPSVSFLVIVRGEVAVTIGKQENYLEIARLGSGQLVGEMSVILDDFHPYTCFAKGKLAVLRFASQVFYENILPIPFVNIPVLQPVSEKMKNSAGYPTFLENRKILPGLDPELVKLLPVDFMQRHGLIPVKRSEGLLVIGHSGVIDQEQLDLVAKFLPDDVDLRTVYFAPDYFSRLMLAAVGENSETGVSGAKSGAGHIDELLMRLIEEGGSDLYLSAGQIPRWRIDGEILEVPETGKTGAEEVVELLKPLARPEILASFSDTCDEDFAYSTADNSRFRVNLLRDHNGVSAVFRYIPGDIRSFESLDLPKILTEFCSQSKGLVLVTGPTGCGKSTTLSAMIDWINRRRKCHILTIEDPIEFVHNSLQALVNQREVGIHTRSFAKALRAGLRENPDVVMVGEIRDNETMAMALETANTGHLVFATLHTATAASTVDRVIDNFPPEAQSQIRMFLAESLVGVVCQTLCRRVAGGCVPAFEIMVMDAAMANLVRTSKTYMLPNAMITAQTKGNRLLNDDLSHLVKNKIISYEEAMNKTRDKAELERKLASPGHAVPEKES